jgi:hypothetical protein
MILNDTELKATQERIAWFCGIVAQLRAAESAENFRFMSSGYLSEIEMMQAEVLAYLRLHTSEALSAQAA